jgi:molybdate transport repressor ModE-like protein
MANWLGVEPRHLSALVAVHAAGSFRAAATRLDVAQSAVSQRIVQLEQLVGTQLVERKRGRTSVELTEAGLRLVGHAERIVAELDAATADLRDLVEHDAPTLRIGGFESVARSLIPGALRRLAQTAPTVRVELSEDPDWKRFFPLVAGGRLDAAFADLPLEPGPFAFRELLHDPSVLLVHKDSPLAHRAEPPTLEEIGALPLIAGSWPMTRLIADHIRAAGIEPRFEHQADLNTGLQALVSEGVGAAFSPALSVIEDPGTVAIPLGSILPARRIAIYWHRQRRRADAIHQFVDALAAECEIRQRALDQLQERGTIASPAAATLLAP